MDVGENDGTWEAVGSKEGDDDGKVDGVLFGNAEGYVDGTVDGTCVGIVDGMTLGCEEGIFDGGILAVDGCEDGPESGSCEEGEGLIIMMVGVEDGLAACGCEVGIVGLFLLGAVFFLFRVRSVASAAAVGTWYHVNNKTMENVVAHTGCLMVGLAFCFDHNTNQHTFDPFLTSLT
jgi:hypothetical protein